MSDIRWKKKERELGKLLWQYDSPSDLHKPRTGDIKEFGADAESLRWIGESKSTSKSSFRVERGILDKLRDRAKKRNKLYVLQVSLPYEDYYILDKEVFIELVEAYKSFKETDLSEIKDKDFIYNLKVLKEACKKILKRIEQ